MSAKADNAQAGMDDLRNIGLNERDTLGEIAVSGRAPYALAGLRYAKEAGAGTISLTCNPDSAMPPVAGNAISPLVGP